MWRQVEGLHPDEFMRSVAAVSLPHKRFVALVRDHAHHRRTVIAALATSPAAAATAVSGSAAGTAASEAALGTTASDMAATAATAAKEAALYAATTAAPAAASDTAVTAATATSLKPHDDSSATATGVGAGAAAAAPVTESVQDSDVRDGGVDGWDDVPGQGAGPDGVSQEAGSDPGS
jgi:hypothetical protein